MNSMKTLNEKMNSMKTLDEKIKWIDEESKEYQEEIVNGCKQYEDQILNSKKSFHLGGMTAITLWQNKSTKEEVQLIKAEAEAELSDAYKGDRQYKYFEDVCYFDENYKSKFYKYCKDNLVGYDHYTLFMTANHLKYLELYIRKLDINLKNCKRDRVEKPPTRAVISVLAYIGHVEDHEATAPLIKLLASFKGDYSNSLHLYSHRIAYIMEKAKIKENFIRPYNSIFFTNLKKEYRKKIKDLYQLMKKNNPREYKAPTETLLGILDLVIKPSDI